MTGKPSRAGCVVSQKFTVAAHGSTSGVPSSLVIRLFSDLRGARAELPFPGLENFVPAVPYHFCLNLPSVFSQLGNGNLAQPCWFVLWTGCENGSRVTVMWGLAKPTGYSSYLTFLHGAVYRARLKGMG